MANATSAEERCDGRNLLDSLVALCGASCWVLTADKRGSFTVFVYGQSRLGFPLAPFLSFPTPT
jgi:hypothetical protein